MVTNGRVAAVELLRGVEASLQGMRDERDRTKTVCKDAAVSSDNPMMASRNALLGLAVDPGLAAASVAAVAPLSTSSTMLPTTAI